MIINKYELYRKLYNHQPNHFIYYYYSTFLKTLFTKSRVTLETLKLELLKFGTIKPYESCELPWYQASTACNHSRDSGYVKMNEQIICQKCFDRFTLVNDFIAKQIIKEQFHRFLPIYHDLSKDLPTDVINIIFGLYLVI